MTRVYTLDVLRTLRQPLVEAGCTWILHRQAGYLTARSNGKPVLTAIELPTGYWLARHYSTETIAWSPSDPDLLQNDYSVSAGHPAGCRASVNPHTT